MEIHDFREHHYEGHLPMPISNELPTDVFYQVKAADSLNLRAMRQVIKVEHHGFRRLDPGKTKMLRKLFPARYSISGTMASGSLPGGLYLFDIIPTGAMDIINRSKGLFDSVEIWTPENIKDPDPIAIGIITGPTAEQHRHYPICRWGEALQPYRVMLDHYHRSRRIFIITPIIGVLLAIMMFTGTFRYLRNEIDAAKAESNSTSSTISLSGNRFYNLSTSSYMDSTNSNIPTFAAHQRTVTIPGDDHNTTIVVPDDIESLPTSVQQPIYFLSTNECVQYRPDNLFHHVPCPSSGTNTWTPIAR